MQLFDENGQLTETGWKIAQELNYRECDRFPCSKCRFSKNGQPGGSGCFVENRPEIKNQKMINILIQAYRNEVLRHRGEVWIGLIKVLKQ